MLCLAMFLTIQTEENSKATLFQNDECAELDSIVNTSQHTRRQKQFASLPLIVICSSQHLSLHPQTQGLLRITVRAFRCISDEHISCVQINTLTDLRPSFAVTFSQLPMLAHIEELSRLYDISTSLALFLMYGIMESFRLKKIFKIIEASIF